MKLTINLFLLGFVLLLCSCNLTRQYVNKSEKRYDGWGRTSWASEQDSSIIYWRKIGDGSQNILLIHGFGPVPQIQWENLVKELYQKYTLYVPDLIYFGKSESAYDNYDPRFLARQILQSFQEFEKDSFYLAGVSYGGFISSLIASTNEEKVEGLILIDALSRHTEKEYADSLANAHGFGNMSQILVPENGKALKTLFKLTFFKPPWYPSFALNNPTRQLYGDQKEQKIGLMSYLYQHESSIKNWEFGYKGPVVIIWGKEDKLIPLQNAYLLQHQYTGAQVKIIDQAAHAVNMEKAGEVAKIINGLIEDKRKRPH